MNIEESFIVLDETPSMLQYSVLDSVDIVEDLKHKFHETSTKPNHTSKNDSCKSSLSHETPPPPKTSTLAQLFLLGDIDCDKIKSYLPSLGIINSNQKEEVKKLENLIKERNDLKDALKRTNATMKEQHSIVNNWQNDVKILKENHEKELNKFRNINDELFQQNYDLQTKVAELAEVAADLSCKTCIQSEKEQCSSGKKERFEEQTRKE
ncbi:uncharacterized protein LOC116351551, partial [Contarinia nasturtii]|uniref:uncharacterized protein LOC116351551 n=1 Tax=Contarinia nasturtii TaxID=265458 RepID=UPI0012D4C333